MELPETKRSYYKTDTFARKLIQYAKTAEKGKEWQQWPNQHRLAQGSKNVYSNRITSGKMWGPGFEGAVRNGVLWARYTGEDDVRG